MAHYAFLNESSIVTEVIVGKDETELIDGLTPEEWYKNFRGQKCVRTSYNAKIRKNYAGIGMIYDPVRDAFYAPQPFESWVLNEETCQWETPIPYPTDGNQYLWDEPSKSWIAA
jgi:hypothetical protein